MAAVTLTTDFGLQDGHVGAMKGVMYSIAPETQQFDISHNVPPQNVRHAAFVVMTAYPFWPSTTVHLVVVDPGVGTNRRAIALRTPAGFFVAPDNGVLSYVLARERIAEVVELSDTSYWRQPVSPVFHGRDIFGPAAAHLASGIPVKALGSRVDLATLVRFEIPKPDLSNPQRVIGHVQHIDHFGNCTTDLTEADLQGTRNWRVHAGERTIEGVQNTFGDVASGEPVVFVDSTGFVAIALYNGNAGQALGLEIGDSILFERGRT